MACFRRSRTALTITLALAGLALSGALALLQAGGGEDPAEREFTLSARRYAFEPARLEVRQDDIVKIVFHAEDIPHSFTIDSYRISKRAGAGQTVTFEFRANQAGTFPFYCNLTADDRCREMRGELVIGSR